MDDEIELEVEASDLPGDDLPEVETEVIADEVEPIDIDVVVVNEGEVEQWQQESQSVQEQLNQFRTEVNSRFMVLEQRTSETAAEVAEVQTEVQTELESESDLEIVEVEIVPEVEVSETTAVVPDAENPPMSLKRIIKAILF